MLEKRRKIHFIGIGGVGMSGLALVLSRMGHEVTGCDLTHSKYIEPLIEAGIKIYIGHDPSHLEDVEIVVFTSALPKDNLELRAAKEKGLIILPRAKMLSEVMRFYNKSIVVAGSHGKTTTTSMIAEILLNLKLEPTVIVGGIIRNVKTNSFLGKGEYLVAEADESDGSFLFYSPFIEVITNIDKEHLDFYADFEAIKKAFANFIMRCHPEGKVILCIDDKGIREVLEDLSGPYLFYGFSEDAHIRGKIIEGGAYPLFEIYFGDTKLGTLRLNIPGKHNVLNALGAISVAKVLNLPMKRVLKILENFKGVKRRLDFKGDYKGAFLIDDYAHHPREITETLKTLRELFPKKKICLVFQPHRYTRTKALWEEFLLTLKEPDLLILTDIYPASEKPLPGISGESFYQAVKDLRSTKPTFYEKELERVKDLIETLADKEMIIVTMGAGNVYKVLDKLGKWHEKVYEVA
ncbi:MAG: UDP-N-acetylmuramate--L-alanine ligase [Caldimicrobium sp.]